jgi:sugar/nucleoside kinase (ribokinase family)
MIECVIPLASLPAENTTLIVNAPQQQLGGNAFNICWYLRLMGLHPLLVGPYGMQNRALVYHALSEANLAESGLIAVDGDTDLLVAMVTAHYHRSVYLCAQLPHDIDTELAQRGESADSLVLTGSRHTGIRQAQIRLAEAYKGELLTFSPSYAISEYSPYELQTFCERAHLVILNEQEARLACARLEVADSRQLASKCRNMLVVTLAERGADLYEQGRLYHIGTYTTSSADVIGAGDAFLSGMLFRMLHKQTAIDAANFGAALAAFVVNAGQVRVHITKEQVRAKLACHSLESR